MSKLILDEWIVREVIDTLHQAKITLLGVTGLDSPQEVAKKCLERESAITRRIDKSIDIVQQSDSSHSEIPNNHESLDEAAEKYERDGTGINKEVGSVSIYDAFKAGAEWAFGRGIIVRGWIARHKNGELCLFWNKPEYKINLGWVDEHQHWKVIDPHLFPQIKMKDSPVEIIVQIRKP